MTIGSTSPARVSFNCDGASKTFPVPIQAYQATDLTVILTAPASAGGAESTLNLNSDYALAPSGTLQPNAWVLTTLAVAAYAVGYTLQVFINPVQQQQTQYVQGQAFPSLAVQTNIDRLTQMVQRLQDEVGRAIRAPDGDVAPAMLLPTATARANTGLAMDANGNVSLAIIPTIALTQTIFNTFLAAAPPYPITAAETAAGAAPQDLTMVPDGVGKMSVFRYFTPTQKAAVVAGFNTVDVSAAIQAANNFIEGTALGSIASYGAFTPGAGYTNGVYVDVALTGGAGQFATADITVAGGIVTVFTPVTQGNGYQVGNVLSCASIGAGAGFAVPVATLQSGGKRAQQGGTLFFPTGYYYLGNATPRVGGNVRWEGSQSTASSFNWAAGYTGNGIQFGPDNSGFYGFSGFYVSQSSIEQFLINTSVNQAWGLYCTGGQQGCYFGHLIVNGVGPGGGIFYKDQKGASYFRMYDIEIIGGAACSSATSVGLSINGSACCQIDQISVNGSDTTTHRFFQGISINGNGSVNGGGGVQLTNYDSELNVTGLDIAANAGTGSSAIVVDSMSINSNNSQGIWIHNGYTGSLIARGVGGGSGVTMLRNDNTGEVFPAQGAGTILPTYTYSAVPTDVSYSANTVIASPLVQVNPPPVTTLNATSSNAYDINVANNTAITIAAPLMGASAMPATARIGQRIVVKVRNISGGVIPALTWNAVFKMSAFTAPANGNSRSIEFQWNGTNWVQLWQSTVDVPN